ncbi:hypothetical protein [Erythrobacter litoralis]|uniref:hypothetical protein n=1 Tax=Erythrobacter litoralis TaxID=39960 RepID=UPI002434B087|nr:hypothetical protein [Erythrobacter litoralis]
MTADSVLRRALAPSRSPAPPMAERNASGNVLVSDMDCINLVSEVAPVSDRPAA